MSCAENARRYLSSGEAQQRLAHYGYNEIPRRRPDVLKLFFSKLWGPIPWMLEIAILLELLSDRQIEATIIFALLVVNAAIGFVHERRAHDAVEALRSRLQISARVVRDGTWMSRPAREIVPGDVVHVRMGDIVPADLQVIDGSVLVDESVLTGESLPVERAAGSPLFSASTLKRGEATAVVVATGTRTKFGVTAELVRAGDTGGHLRDRAFGIVRYLVAADAVLLLAYAIAALIRVTAPLEVVTFAVTLLLGAIPVALPATFTLATAIGATRLAAQHVLVTHLSAIEDAAVMDVLCVDKTGTLTENRLSIAAVVPLDGVDERDVLEAAALASDPATQDPLDLAVLEESTHRGIAVSHTNAQIHPFDPERKYAETVIVGASGSVRKAVKGARTAVSQLCGVDIARDVPDRLAAEGNRVLTVAADDGRGYRPLGFIAFGDALRPDAANLIERVRAAGIRVMMLTGDTLGTAAAVARRLGLDRVISAEDIRRDPGLVESADVVARVLPEDKFAIVRRLQNEGHTCGMTGDGVNDAPALQAAQVGIAVSGATDAAKAAASLVLTTAGLAAIIPTIEESRRIFRRLTVYTINKVTKTLELGLVLTIAALVRNFVPLTPLLMILLIFGNDFATMSISADRVAFSVTPERWSSRRLMLQGIALAAMLCAFSLAALFFALDTLGLTKLQVQTVMFLLFVCSSQGLIYLLRDRRGFWCSMPAFTLLGASLVDVAICVGLAVTGTLMASIPFLLAAEIVAAVLVYLALLGFVIPKTFTIRLYSRKCPDEVKEAGKTS